MSSSMTAKNTSAWPSTVSVHCHDRGRHVDDHHVEAFLGDLKQAFDIFRADHIERHDLGWRGEDRYLVFVGDQGRAEAVFVERCSVRQDVRDDVPTGQVEDRLSTEPCCRSRSMMQTDGASLSILASSQARLTASVVAPAPPASFCTAKRAEGEDSFCRAVSLSTPLCRPQVRDRVGARVRWLRPTRVPAAGRARNHARPASTAGANQRVDMLSAIRMTLIRRDPGARMISPMASISPSSSASTAMATNSSACASGCSRKARASPDLQVAPGLAHFGFHVVDQQIKLLNVTRDGAGQNRRRLGLQCKFTHVSHFPFFPGFPGTHPLNDDRPLRAVDGGRDAPVDGIDPTLLKLSLWRAKWATIRPKNRNYWKKRRIFSRRGALNLSRIFGVGRVSRHHRCRCRHAVRAVRIRRSE